MSSALAHITIVLVRPQQAGNIGVAARAIANHGLGGLALVAPPHFDPERTRWMAPKSHHIINQALFCESISEAVANVQRVVATSARPRTREWSVFTPEELSASLAHKPVPTAILFGPEDSGLSNEDLRLAESILHFPTTDKVSSINLGQAVTATAAALAAGARLHAPQPEAVQSDLANTARREELVQRVVSVLESSGYLNGRSEEIVTNTLIRIAARTHLENDEVNNLLGMVKQLEWWFKEQPK